MPLLLKTVEAGRGAGWVADAFRLYARQPFAFTLLFVLYFFAFFLVARVVPYGGVLALMTMPLLSLGFMVASQAALLSTPVRPLHFVEALRGERDRRKALLVLCAVYGAASFGAVYLADAISGHALERLVTLLGRGVEAEQEVQSLLADPRTSLGVMAGAALITLLAVLFWHAPALVHWGGQSAGQALFSSTLAVWRNKSAFFVYGLAWFGVGVLFSMAGGLVVAVSPALGQALLMLLSVVPQTVFYVSLLFTFNDSFGGAGATPPESASPR